MSNVYKFTAFIVLTLSIYMGVISLAMRASKLPTTYLHPKATTHR